MDDFGGIESVGSDSGSSVGASSDAYEKKKNKMRTIALSVLFVGMGSFALWFHGLIPV